jgi:hypothetical protein
MVDDDGSGTTGTVLNNAWKQQLYDQIDAALPPATVIPPWNTVPWDAVNFWASSGIWTVESADQINISYMMITPATMFLSVDIRGTSISIATQFLHMRVPGGKLIRGNTASGFAMKNNVTSYAGFAFGGGGNSVMYYCLTAGLGVWQPGTNDSSVIGTAILDVYPPAQQIVLEELRARYGDLGSAEAVQAATAEGIVLAPPNPLIAGGL